MDYLYMFIRGALRYQLFVSVGSIKLNICTVMDNKIITVQY